MEGARRRIEEKRKELFSAELQKFWNTHVLETSSEGVSSEIECTHVTIQRIDLGIGKEKHRIIVQNASSEVCSYAFDDITQLHHIVEDNLVGWSGTDDNVALTFNLRLKDRNHANDFVRMVKEFSQLSLTVVNSHTSKTEHVYS